MRAWQARPGDPQLADRVAGAVYNDLHAIAAARLRRESAPPFTPTELVHEAWLRLRPQGEPIADRSHFFRLASVAMRRLLIDHARERLAAKRGGGAVRVTLSLADAGQPFDDHRLLDLDRALNALADQHPRAAETALLRCFGGLTLDEVAQAMESSLATVKRDLRFAHAWLADAIGDEERTCGS
jgi:RNA polymerase sigma factor (TIGR02999 family)